MVNFFVEAQGIKQAQLRFNRMGAAAVDMSPAFRRIAIFMMAIEEEVFQSQGRRGGGSWKQLTPDWLERKAKLGWDPRINIARGDMMNSVTIWGAKGQRLDIWPDRMYFGSRLPQAEPSQKYRPFMKFTVADRERFTQIIGERFLEVWMAPVE